MVSVIYLIAPAARRQCAFLFGSYGISLAFSSPFDYLHFYAKYFLPSGNGAVVVSLGRFILGFVRLGSSASYEWNYVKLSFLVLPTLC